MKLRLLLPLVLAASFAAATPLFAKVQETLQSDLIIYVVVGECKPEYEIAARLSFNEKKAYFHTYNLKYKLTGEDNKLRERLILMSDIFFNSVGDCV